MYTTFSQELLPLISYFDRTYISDTNNNARYPPSPPTVQWELHTTLL